MRLRSCTVEPVWGTLLNFMKMKKVYTKGNKLAYKQLLMAAATYNLKKLMKFVSPKSIAKEAICVANKVKSCLSRFNNGMWEEIFVFLRTEVSIFTYCHI